MTKRAMLWTIAVAVMGFFLLAAINAGDSYCSGFDELGRWFGDCSSLLPSRLAVLLIGLVPGAVLVYFAEKGVQRTPLRAHSIMKTSTGGYFCNDCHYGFPNHERAMAHYQTTLAKAQQAAATTYGFKAASNTLSAATRSLQQTAQQATSPQASAASGVKKCPDCAEEIRAEARKCRFCGYRFADTSATA